MTTDLRTTRYEKRSKLGVDLDGVIASLWTEVVAEVKKLYNVDLPQEDNLQKYDIEKCTDITREQLTYIFKKGNVFKNPGLIHGAKEAIDRLNEDFSIHIITNRDCYPGIEYDTAKWLRKNKIQYREIIYTDEKKAPHVIKANVEYMIENKGETAYDLADMGQKMLLLDYPYNRAFEHKNIIRVYSWHDILDKLIVIDEHEYI